MTLHALVNPTFRTTYEKRTLAERSACSNKGLMARTSACRLRWPHRGRPLRISGGDVPKCLLTILAKDFERASFQCKRTSMEIC